MSGIILGGTELPLLLTSPIIMARGASGCALAWERRLLPPPASHQLEKKHGHDAENQSLPVVRQRGRAGGSILYGNLQEFADHDHHAVWHGGVRRAPSARRFRDDRRVRARRAAVHRAQR